MLRDGSYGQAQVVTGSAVAAACQLLDWLQQLEVDGEAAGAAGDDAAEPD
ncbi:hypothetical protein [Streptomyces sp. HUAS ZL42]